MAFPLPLEAAELAAPRCWAEVDLGAIKHNIRALRRHLAPSKVTAVVKANAYGLGAEMIARAAVEAGAYALAVSSCEEGRDLRRAGLTNIPILVLGYVPLELAPLAVENELTITVNSSKMAHALSKAIGRSRHTIGPLPVHLKLDTGLHRYGLTQSEALELARLISTLPGLTLQGLYSHFATAEEPDPTFVHEQQLRFDASRDFLASHGFHFAQHHLSNSAAGISFKDARRSFVRVGLAMYGYYGSTNVEAHARRAGLFLQPSLTLKSVVARVSEVEVGETVGYNRTFEATRTSRLALVPFGYADGYRRALANRAHVLINGQRVPVVGKVSMDQITIDITDLPGVQEGDEVVLMGSQQGNQIAIEEIAGLCDTISYEIITGLGPRVKRIYLD